MLIRISLIVAIIGGLAVFYYVVARDPLLARLTKDVDLAVNRADLDRIRQAVRQSAQPP